MTPLRIRRRPAAVPDGTLPLINIVLLLVLAFMIAGTLAEPLPAGFEPLASQAESTVQEAAAPLRMVVESGGRILVEGRPQTEAGTARVLAAAGETGRALAIRADANSPAIRVIGLLAQAEAAGIAQVEIMTVGRRP